MSNTNTRSPDAIENDIERTQDEMSRTVDQIGEQLNPQNIFNALLESAKGENFDAKALVDGARRNPLALALIATGGIWLASDHEAHPRSFTSKTGEGSDDDTQLPALDTSYNRDYQSYVAHMSRCERRDGEDDIAYRRRRDDARATFFMIERGYDEDEKSYRERLDEAGNKLRATRDDMAQKAQKARKQAMQKLEKARGELGARSRQGANRVGSAYQQNPVLGGLIAAVIGMIAGSSVPATRTERGMIGDHAEKAVDRAKNEAENLAEQAREKKDEVVSKTQDKLEPSEDSSARVSQPNSFEASEVQEPAE